MQRIQSDRRSLFFYASDLMDGLPTQVEFRGATGLGMLILEYL